MALHADHRDPGHGRRSSDGRRAAAERFLSKEMFFAETIEIHDNSLVDRALPYIVTVASMFTVAYSLRFIRDVFFGPAPTGLPRTPHEPPS